jgi:hypothetical protein
MREWIKKLQFHKGIFFIQVIFIRQIGRRDVKKRTKTIYIKKWQFGPHPGDLSNETYSVCSIVTKKPEQEINYLVKNKFGLEIILRALCTVANRHFSKIQSRILQNS